MTFAIGADPRSRLETRTRVTGSGSVSSGLVTGRDRHALWPDPTSIYYLLRKEVEQSRAAGRSDWREVDEMPQDSGVHDQR